MTKFMWNDYPTSPASFEALMHAVDSTLASSGLQPFQRPLHVGKKLWEAFGWSGNVIPPKELANQPGFMGDVLMAKAHRWYEEMYGDRLNSNWAYGYVPAKLGNTVWKVRMGVIFGRVSLFADRNLANRSNPLSAPGVEASSNVLRDVEDLPQGFADRLSDAALSQHFQLHAKAHQTLQWRESLPSTELLNMARSDYDQSTEDVLSRRYGQARWAAEQAVEKTFKGILQVAGTEFPTGGQNGHNLKHLAGLLSQKHGISVSTSLCDLASCSPKVRYGEEPSSEAQALIANHAVLEILDQLRGNPKTEPLLNKKNSEG